MSMRTEPIAVPAPQERRSGGCTGQYSARMLAIRKWVCEHCCAGRTMKTPVPRGRDWEVRWEEPRCFGGDFYPVGLGSRKNPYSIAPSILIFRTSFSPQTETEKYVVNGMRVSRPKELASSLSLYLVHTIYEPGERTGEEGEGPKETFQTCEEIDTGSLILGDWMDDTCAALLAEDALSGTGLYVDSDSVTAGALVENGSVSDRRPIYMGVVTVTLVGLTRVKQSGRISRMLD